MIILLNFTQFSTNYNLHNFKICHIVSPLRKDNEKREERGRESRFWWLTFPRILLLFWLSATTSYRLVWAKWTCAKRVREGAEIQTQTGKHGDKHHHNTYLVFQGSSDAWPKQWKIQLNIKTVPLKLFSILITSTSNFVWKRVPIFI